MGLNVTSERRKLMHIICTRISRASVGAPTSFNFSYRSIRILRWISGCGSWTCVRRPLGRHVRCMQLSVERRPHGSLPKWVLWGMREVGWSGMQWLGLYWRGWSLKWWCNIVRFSNACAGVWSDIGQKRVIYVTAYLDLATLVHIDIPLGINPLLSIWKISFFRNAECTLCSLDTLS